MLERMPVPCQGGLDSAFASHAGGQWSLGRFPPHSTEVESKEDQSVHRIILWQKQTSVIARRSVRD